MIAHRLETIRHVDRICVFMEGRVVDEGTHDQLMKNEHGKYRALWNAQQSGDIVSDADANHRVDGLTLEKIEIDKTIQPTVQNTVCSVSVTFCTCL